MRGSTKLGQLIHGDCLSVLKTVASASVDLICTDPPYGIGFQNKSWDRFDRSPHCDNPQRSFGEFIRVTGAACLRVLKPGGFLFMAMTPRQDSLARAIVGLEDAGFKVNFTSLYWTFATGFPKAANVAKLVDRRQDAQDGPDRSSKARLLCKQARAVEGAYAGFQPKPAVEVIIVAMKPLSETSFVDQALINSKGISWLDDVRIPTQDSISVHHAPSGSFAGGKLNRGSIKNYRVETRGRFPANLLVSDEALGSQSRFFSLDAWTAKHLRDADQHLPFLTIAKAGVHEKPLDPSGAPHPTVKPLKLMAYLIALGSRPGDVVLDPFLGSGTTAVAAKMLGRRYLGIERDRAYLEMARSRLACVKRVQPSSAMC